MKRQRRKALSVVLALLMLCSTFANYGSAFAETTTKIEDTKEVENKTEAATETTTEITTEKKENTKKEKSVKSSGDAKEINVIIRKRESGSASGQLVTADVTKGLALADLDNGQAVITYIGPDSSTGNKITLKLPEYYSFKTPILNDEYFQNVSVSDIDGGTDNQVTVTIKDEYTQDAQNKAISFDFDIKLNRDSIDSTREVAWGAGAWEPQDGHCDFSLEHNDTEVVAQRKTLKVQNEEWKIEDNVRVNLQSVYTGDDKNSDHGKKNMKNLEYKKTVTNIDGLWKYGYGDEYGKSNTDSMRITGLNISYSYPDIFKYNPGHATHLKYTVTLPSQFEFTDYVESTFSSSHANVIISGDKSQATIEVSDTSNSMENLNRSIAALQVEPKEEYRNGTSELPPNTMYELTTTVKMDDGSSRMVPTGYLKTRDYVESNGFGLKASGELDDKVDHIILKEEKPQTTITIAPSSSHALLAGLGSMENVRSYKDNVSHELDYDGEDAKYVTEFDDNIEVSQITLNNDVHYLSSLAYEADHQWKGYTVTYNDNSTDTMILTSSESNKIINAPAGKTIKKVEVTYEKFRYHKNVYPISGMKCKIAEKKDGTTEWEGREDLPINQSVVNNNGTKVAEAVNYIRVKALECPTFIKGNYTNSLTNTYSDGQTVTSASVYLKDVYVGQPKYEDGTDAPAKKTIDNILKNPVFSVAGGSAYMYAISNTIATNGKLHLAPIMGDGKWTVKVSTQSAEGLKAAAAVKEYTCTLPAFSQETEVNLRTMCNIPENEYIMGFSLSHDGDLDLSELSNRYTDKSPSYGTAVNKMLFTAEATAYSVSPLTGEYINRDITNYTFVCYDNCHDIDYKHEPDKKGYKIDQYGTSYTCKGAETMIPAMQSKGATTYDLDVVQGRTNQMTIKTPMTAWVTDKAKLLSTGGEVFYYYLGDDAIKYLSFSNAKVDGKAAELEMVTIRGKKYLKVTSPKREQYEKARVSTIESGRLATFEPWEVTMDVYALPMTPTSRNLDIIKTQDINNQHGGCVEFNDTAYQEYTEGGQTYRVAITLGSALNVRDWPISCYYDACMDDFLQLHNDTPITERHLYLIDQRAFTKKTSAQAYQGVILNPGINGQYSDTGVEVKPWDTNSLSLMMTIMAGQGQSMVNFESTIPLPRKGVEVEYDGVNYKSDVDVYLKGPAQLNIDFQDSATTTPSIRYSIDGGVTWLSQSKITDWKEVTHVYVTCSNIAASDACSYTLPIEKLDATGIGEAYVPAKYSTESMQVSSNRMNTYRFLPTEIDGVIWDDANKDGNKDTGESFVATKVALYENYGTATEAKLEETTSSAADGTYHIESGKYKDLTLVAELPGGKTVTIPGDNKFISTGTGYGKYTLATELSADVANADMGVRDITPVNVTSIGGTKTIMGADATNAGIAANEYTFKVEADSSNPAGASGVSSTVKNGTGAATGAPINFTGTTGWTFNRAGTYKFKITEQGPSPSGYQYDDSVYNVTVVVTENVATYALEASATVTKGSAAAPVAINALNFANIKKAYTVKYDTNGGTPASIPNKTNVGWDNTNLLPSSNPTKAGATFDHWEITKAGSPETVTNASRYSDLVADDTVTEVTIKAIYIDKNYTVKYDTDGGTPGTISDKTSVKWNDDNLLPTPPTKTGYIFGGWKVKAGTGANAGTVVASDTAYSALVTGDTIMDVTLQAQWKEKDNFVVSYDLDGGTATPALTDKTGVKWTDSNFLPPSTTVITKPGHRYSQWKVASVSRSTTNVLNTDTYAILAGNDDTVTSITLSPKWEKKNFTVKWETEDTAKGTISPTGQTESVAYEDYATKDITATPVTGGDTFQFVGWHYKYLPDGLADVPANYVEGTASDYKSVPIKGDVTFTAMFSKEAFVNINAIDGHVAANKTTTPPTTVGTDANVRLDYASMNASGENAAIAFEAKAHYHLEKVTVKDLYGNEKIIYTTVAGETADTTFAMHDSTLDVTFDSDGTLIIKNMKNSLNIDFVFKEDPKYNVNFYGVEKDDVTSTTTPIASNTGLYSGDEYGEAPAESLNPTKAGWKFVGWSYNGTDVNYNKADKINDSDVAVYPIFTERAYKVSYDLDGGTHQGATSISALDVIFSRDNLLPTPDPEKTGYTFEGWTLNGTAVTSADKYSDLVANDTVESITLKAKWKANQYKVTFDKNSASATGTMADQNFTYDVEQALTANGFARAGYDFAGWSTTATGTLEYTDQEVVKNLTSAENGNVTLYALWNAKGDTPYKVEHYKQTSTGTWESTPDDVVTYQGVTDTTVTAIVKVQTDSGYEATIFDKDNTNNVLQGVVQPDGSLVLKVYYKRLETVKFDTNGGTPAIEDQIVQWGDKLTKPEDPVREGYIFEGWEQGTTTRSMFRGAGSGTLWDFDKDTVTKSMTLKARWTEEDQPNDETTATDETTSTDDKASTRNKSDSGNRNTTTVARTGDETNVFAYLALLAVSAGCILVAYKRRRHRF